MHPVSAPVSSEDLNRYARRGLIVALLLILLLGSSAALVNFSPDSAAARRTGQLLMLLPLLLVFAIVWVRAALPRGQRRVSAVQIRQMVQDELRHDSLRKAFRLSLVGVLVCQPLFGVALTMVPITSAALVMAAATVMVGATLFFVTLLLCDRA